MTYSCSDFTDDIIDALGVDIPDESNDSPSDQADICLEAIARMESARKTLQAIRADNPEFETGAMVDHADVTARLAKRWPEIAAALEGVPMLPATDVFVAIYENRYDGEIRAYKTVEGARAWRREIASQNWAAHMPDHEAKPDDAQEAADDYFHRVGESRGDFFRIEGVKLTGPAAPSPGIDWRAIAQDLAGALSSTVQQIEQMQGMFDDDDGTIQQALDDAEAASGRYSAAGKIAPDAPAPADISGRLLAMLDRLHLRMEAEGAASPKDSTQDEHDLFNEVGCLIAEAKGEYTPEAAPAPATRKVWTLTTDGDNMGICTSVFDSEDAALGAACDVLRMSDKPTPENLETLDSDQISDLWSEIYDGICSIESHDIPA